MNAFSIGLLTFLAAEAICLFTICNLEIGFVPALVLAFVVASSASEDMARADAKRDKPGELTYRVPLPMAMASIKRVLKTFRSGNDRWHINYEDKQTGEIQASLHMVDLSFRELTWLVPTGRIDKNIDVDIILTPKPKSMTEVHIRFSVEAPYTRVDCNIVIADTLYLIEEALENAELKLAAERTRPTRR